MRVLNGTKIHTVVYGNATRHIPVTSIDLLFYRCCFCFSNIVYHQNKAVNNAARRIGGLNWHSPTHFQISVHWILITFYSGIMLQVTLTSILFHCLWSWIMRNHCRKMRHVFVPPISATLYCFSVCVWKLQNGCFCEKNNVNIHFISFGSVVTRLAMLIWCIAELSPIYL